MTRKRRATQDVADIEIGAVARARRLRFSRKPKAEVEFEGKTRIRSSDEIEEADVESDSHSERRNLPEEVEPGVTYHNVEVGWIAGARAVMPERDDEEDS
jgi:hypothetical protein